MTDAIDLLKSALAERYTIERELGAGGMATVYLAHDLKHDRKVAVKVLRPELAAVLGAERFLNEIKVTANLQHPHILPLFDSGRADRRTGGRADGGAPAEFLYYVMPYVEGESLRDKLNREKQLTIAEALKIATQVAEALHSAHQQGVVHRDVKPENILLREGHALVADFGIALAVKSAGGERLTETGLSLGTPQYMSPEQATGDREIDARCDIYSLASVLYEMLSGEPPHTGPTVQAVIAKLVSDRPRPIEELRDTVPPPLSAALTKALAKLPADRFETTASFCQAFATVESTGSAPVSTSGSSIRQGLLVGTATAAIVIVCAAWWFLSAGEDGAWEIERIAVLPPDNLTGQPEQDFYLEGMHDRLIAVLGEVVRNEVDVLGRRSVMRYRDSELSVREIANELSVDALIELSASVGADSAHVTAGLVRGETEALLWSHTFGRELQYIRALYGDVAHGVASAIRGVVLPDEEVQLAVAPGANPEAAIAQRVNPEAYSMYLRGRMYQNRLDPIEPDLERAIGFFQQALEEDSTFASAYAGISMCFGMLGAFNIIRPDSAWPRMEQAVDLAMRYDEEAPDTRLAHAARLYYGWDLAESNRVLERLYSGSPSHVDVVLWYALSHATFGQIDRALELTRRAKALEPSDPMALIRMSWVLNTSRQWDESIELMQRVLSEDPGYGLAHWHLAEAYAGRGDLELAVEAIRAAMAVMEQDDLGDEYGVLGFLYGRLGRTAEALEQLEHLNRLAQTGRFVTPIASALVHMGVGDTDAALTLLEEGYENHDGWVLWAMLSPLWESLRTHPRYQEIRRRLNFPTLETN